MDLVMVSPRAEPPVVRITEWSKVVYEVQKREKAAAKQALAQKRAADPKEVRFSCQIGEHDLGVKMAQVGGLLQSGSVRAGGKTRSAGQIGGLSCSAASTALLAPLPSFTLRLCVCFPLQARKFLEGGNLLRLLLSRSRFYSIHNAFPAGPQVFGGGQPAAPGGAVQGRAAGGWAAGALRLMQR